MARVVLLIPSATYRASDFLEAAQRMGVEVVVAGEHRHALADVLGQRSLVVDLDDPQSAADAIVAHDSRFPVDAVVAVDERGTVVAAEASRRLGLRHNPPDAVAAAGDKRLMRARFDAAEVPQPEFAEIPAGADHDEMTRLASDVGFPCVVKPTTLSGSRGVLRVDDASGLPAVVDRVRRIAREAGVDPERPLLVERFVPGPELAVEGLLRQGRLEVLALFDKPDPLDGPAFEETLYITPSRLAESDQRAAVGAVAAATRALGLREGPVHAEVRVAAGRAAVIEVAARTIGGLCARTLTFGTGRSLEELVLAHALGSKTGDRADQADQADHRVSKGAAGVLMLPIPRPGVLVSVEGRQQALAVPGVTGVEITIASGRPLAPPPEGDRYLGFVFARGPDARVVEKALRAAWTRLDVRVDP